MKISRSDYLVIGSGLAGLAFALKAADFGSVIVLSKSAIDATNTARAQGGIAAVMSSEDSFDQHLQDTLKAGAGLCQPEVAGNIVQQAPERIADLIDWGVDFDIADQEGQKVVDLTREGGHSQRRILHVEDHTGRDIQQALQSAVLNHKNIQFVENAFAIDLITNRQTDPLSVDAPECYGAYVFSQGEVSATLAKAVILATGGAGKVFRYTSNWSGATGDGIAMAYRAGCRVSNMEFTQFHPTCLYHPSARSFLITEALRGEGGILKNAKGEAFMRHYTEQAELAPRDIVARSIDAEMKKSGAECVYLDISHLDSEFVKSRFPLIYQKCMALGIDITKEAIPVVPAAHYLCGGVLTDVNGQTDVKRLYAVGETASTGLHGANRLASNSLLECLAVAHNAVEVIRAEKFELPEESVIPQPQVRTNYDDDELIVIHHLWDEIRSLMWNYVGIVRTDKRLERAIKRLQFISAEIREYYGRFRPHTDIMEVRNIAQVASLIVESAIKRKESRGTHYNLDYPESRPDPLASHLGPTNGQMKTIEN